MSIVLPLAIPWFAAALLALLDGRRLWVAGLGLLSLGATLLASLSLAQAVFAGDTIQVTTGGWPAGIGINLRADSLGVFFLVLADGLLLLALLYETLRKIHDRTFPAVLLFLTAGMNGLFLTGDAFNFYVFFEVSMTAAFVLAAYGPERQSTRNAFVFIVVNLLGSTFFLLGVVALYRVTGTLNMPSIGLWVEEVEPISIILISTVIFVAFSLKLGLFPFHFWLPPVYNSVQPVVAAVLAGVLANIGSYGLLRFGAGILTEEVAFGAPALFFLGVASAVFGAVLAVNRKTVRLTLAYSSVSQAGYVLIGLAIGGPEGLIAAVLMSTINALDKTLLFLADGIHGRWVGPAFVLGAFSVAGLPPAAGFFAKAALFRTTLFANRPFVLALLLFSAALAFLYMFRAYQRRFWPPASGVPLAGIPAGEGESPLPLQLAVLLLALAIIGLGLWPELLLWMGTQAATALEVMP